MEPIVIRAARPADRAGVEALLAAAGLPTDGVAEHFASFFVVDHGSKIGGVAGVELYGEHALLRSVAVANDMKGEGVGALLTRRVLDEAKARGASAIYLLTTTAERYFPRFGFQNIAREEVPESVRASREFQGACPASAIAMRRDLRR
jgi:amino-acid N-acetyltransferase